MENWLSTTIPEKVSSERRKLFDHSIRMAFSSEKLYNLSNKRLTVRLNDVYPKHTIVIRYRNGMQYAAKCMGAATHAVIVCTHNTHLQ